MEHIEQSASTPNAATKLALERTFLSYERTMLSWVRTATSLITFGFSIEQFFRIARQGVTAHQGLIGPHEFGLTTIIIGLLALVLATWNHRSAIQALKTRYRSTEQYPDIPRSRATMLAALIAVLGLLALFSVILRE
jgi:putative membrane protein